LNHEAVADPEAAAGSRGAPETPHRSAPAVSVAICAYTLDRWKDLRRAVESVREQSPPPAEVLLVIDHNDGLLARARDEWPPLAGDAGGRAADGAAAAAAPPVTVLASEGGRGLAGARNTAVRAARSEIVAFLDDDAAAAPGWIGRLGDAYADEAVVACGGAAIPDLRSPRPRWWPREFDWVIGCSYVGMPTDRAEVRNVLGANMSARRACIEEIGGFDETLGRVRRRPAGCEETDLCIRLAARRPGSVIVYDPAAAVHHSVPTSRLTWHYFRTRCYAEGLSKAQVTRNVGAGAGLASERAYTREVLPRAVLRGLGATLSRRGTARPEDAHPLQAAAVCAGLAITTAGYALGVARTSWPSALRKTRRPAPPD
jgi:GT2 family glycosyltransferase